MGCQFQSNATGFSMSQDLSFSFFFFFVFPFAKVPARDLSPWKEVLQLQCESISQEWGIHQTGKGVFSNPGDGGTAPTNRLALASWQEAKPGSQSLPLGQGHTYVSSLLCNGGLHLSRLLRQHRRSSWALPIFPASKNKERK